MDKKTHMKQIMTQKLTCSCTQQSHENTKLGDNVYATDVYGKIEKHTIYV